MNSFNWIEMKYSIMKMAYFDFSLVIWESVLK